MLKSSHFVLEMVMALAPHMPNRKEIVHSNSSLAITVHMSKLGGLTFGCMVDYILSLL
jgi:hypothetical protein